MTEIEQLAAELEEATFKPSKGIKVHACEKYEKANRNLRLEDYVNGEAILGTMTFEDDTKRWWIGNGSCCSPIYHCPYCGLDLSELHWTGN